MSYFKVQMLNDQSGRQGRWGLEEGYIGMIVVLTLGFWIVFGISRRPSVRETSWVEREPRDREHLLTGRRLQPRQPVGESRGCTRGQDSSLRPAPREIRLPTSRTFILRD